MKKLLALIVALVMLAAAGLAGADSLEMKAGTPSGCGIEMFKLYFSVLEQQAGYTFVWDDNVESSGKYLVYTGRSEDDMMVLNIYTQDGNIVYAEGFGTLIANLSDQDSAQKFGEWFGAAISGMVFGLYIGENGTESVDVNLTNRFTNELIPLANLLTGELDSDEKMEKGIAGTSTILGYPTGLEMSGTSSGQMASLVMRLLVTSSDGTITVK